MIILFVLLDKQKSFVINRKHKQNWAKQPVRSKTNLGKEIKQCESRPWAKVMTKVKG